jgi:uncharacterized tellurite resistance protein B-like protein
MRIEIGRRVLARRRRPVRVESDDMSDDMADGFTMQQAQLDRLTTTMEDIRKTTMDLVTQMALLEQRLTTVERRLTWMMLVVIVALAAALIWVMLRR